MDGEAELLGDSGPFENFKTDLIRAGVVSCWLECSMLSELNKWYWQFVSDENMGREISEWAVIIGLFVLLCYIQLWEEFRMNAAIICW